MFSLAWTTARTQTINQPAAKVIAKIGDFSCWQAWSPWLCQEPDCRIEISGQAMTVGHSQSWEGQRIGSGKITISEIITDKLISYDLHFYKPWKSQNKATFSLSPQGEGTEVQWSMEGSLPIFLFFMRKMMAAFVGSDFDRGLLMLKDLVESGQVLSRSEVKDVSEQPGFFYCGFKTRSTQQELASSMQQDFTSLSTLVEEKKLPPPDFMLSLYEQCDLVKNRYVYIAAYGYKHQPPALSGLNCGYIDNHRAFQVEHFGSYRYLGNAWSTLISCQRRQRLKQAVGLPMYEIYRNFPGQAAEKDLHTSLFLPLA